MKLIFLDTESTGNDVVKDFLCQVCFEIDGKYRTEYFKPPVEMSVKAMSITHITNKMLANKPAFKGSQMQRELNDILKDNVLVAHNARFDIALLEKEDVKTFKSICTLRVARFLDPENAIPEYNLQYLRYHLGIEMEANPHDAESDVKVLHAVFDKLFAKMRNETQSDEEVIKKMIDISSKPSVFSVFNFGKYKDRKIADIARGDKDYLEWLLREKTKNGDQDEDWIYTLKHYLGLN